MNLYLVVPQLGKLQQFLAHLGALVKYAANQPEIFYRQSLLTSFLILSGWSTLKLVSLLKKTERLSSSVFHLSSATMDLY
jgi:hypothetical protein